VFPMEALILVVLWCAIMEVDQIDRVIAEHLKGEL